MAVVVNVYGKTDMAQIDRAQTSLDKLKAKVVEQQSPWQRFGSVMSSTGAKIASGLAFAGIGRWLLGSVDAARQAEAATTSLNRAVTATGTPWITYSGHMEDVITKQSELSAYSQDTLKGALTQLTLTTGSASKGLDLLGLATDLARAKHMDLSKAATLVGKVADGNTTSLSRYGIMVKKGTSATDALAQMQGRFSGQAASYGDSAAGAQEKFTNALHHLQVVIGQAILPLVTAFTDKVTGLLEKFQELPGPVQKILLGVAGFAAAAAILAPWISGIIGAVEAMKLAALAQKAWAAAQWLLNAAMDANPIALIVLAIAGLVIAFVILWKKSDAFRSFWTGLWTEVKAVFAAVWPVIKAVGEKIWGAIKWVWDTVSADVHRFWDWAGPYITAAAAYWWETIKINVAKIVFVVSAVWDAVSGALKTFWNWAGPFITGAVKLWWSGIKANAEAIWTIVKWLWDTVTTGIRAFWDWAGPFITTYVTAWWTVIKTVATAIVVAVKWLWDTVTTGIHAFWDWAGPFIKTAVHVWWSAIKTDFDLIEAVVRAAWSAIKTVVSGGVANIISAIHGIEAVVGFLQGVWDRVKDGASSAVHAVTGFFGGIGGKIKDAIGNAGQLLYSVGQAIVQGLVSGIVDAWHWVTDKLSSLIGGLSSAAKKLLGISSPSKVFMEIGHFTGQGLAAGLDASRGAVSDAAARMVGAASGAPAFGGSAFAGAAGAGGSRSITIAAGAVVVQIGSDQAGTTQQITAAVKAGVDPALAQLARAIAAI